MRKILCISILGAALAGCISNPNQLTLGSLGAAAGGLLGNQVGAGKGKTIATAAGAVLGLLGGSYYGNRFDTIGTNSTAIVDLYKQQSTMRNKQSQNHISPIIYQQPPVVYHYNQQSGGGNMNMNCSIRNNYVVCNGQ